MIPVDQTKFGSPEGNCFNAVIASILEVSIDRITPQVLIDPLFFVKFNKFVLKEFGLFMMEIPTSWPLVPKGYHEMSGPGPRVGDHSVVGKEGRMVHDPHPDRKGLLEVKKYCLFIPIGCALPEVVKVQQI